MSESKETMETAQDRRRVVDVLSEGNAGLAERSRNSVADTRFDSLEYEQRGGAPSRAHARQISETPNLDKFWMPFTANRDFKKRPRLITAADGMYYFTADGAKILDGTAGLWCVNAGHGRREIAQAVNKQMLALDYAPSFLQLLRSSQIKPHLLSVGHAL